MEIKSTTRIENDGVECVAKFQEDETSFLLEWAINHLLANGIQPFLPSTKIDSDTSTH